MARYQKIFAGPVSEALPQAYEALASEALAPGRMVVKSAGELALADGTTDGQVLIAQENYLAMKGPDTPWASGDRAVALHMLSGQFYNALVETGSNLSDGAELSIQASGSLGVAATGETVVAFADETYNNNTGSDQLVRVRASAPYAAA